MTSQIALPVTLLYTDIMSSPHTALDRRRRVQAGAGSAEPDSGAGQHRRPARRDRTGSPIRSTPNPGWCPPACWRPTPNCGPTTSPSSAASARGLRAMLVHNAGGPPPTPGAFAPLREVATDGTARADFDDHGEVLLSSTGDSVPARLIELLLIIRDAQRDGTWARLKACGNDECQWAFYDRSRNHGGTWCEMSSCGNKLKNREFRARRRRAPVKSTGDTPTPPPARPVRSATSAARSAPSGCRCGGVAR